MRQIKNFMEAKRPMWNCNECKCITMQCWKESEAFCGCGESKSGLPNYSKVLANEFGGYEIRFFNDDEEQDNEISLEIDTDTEEGGYRVVVGMFGIIEDEEANALWLNMWESLDSEVVMKLFGIDEGKTGVGQFISEAMAQFNAFLDNPTEEQAAILKEWLENKASNGQLIVIFDPVTLLSHQQIMALADTATRVEELNKAPVEYFNEFTEEGNIVGDHLKDDLLCQWDNLNQEWVEGSR